MSEEIEEIKMNEWIDSIEFVDADGMVVPLVLEDDNSEDPEDDREGV